MRGNSLYFSAKAQQLVTDIVSDGQINEKDNTNLNTLYNEIKGDKTLDPKAKREMLEAIKHHHVGNTAGYNTYMGMWAVSNLLLSGSTDATLWFSNKHLLNGVKGHDNQFSIARKPQGYSQLAYNIAIACGVGKAKIVQTAKAIQLALEAKANGTGVVNTHSIEDVYDEFRVKFAPRPKKGGTSKKED